MSDGSRDAGGSGRPLRGLDERLYPLLAVIIVLLVGDMLSRLSSEAQPSGVPMAGGANENLAASGNRRMQIGEWRATAEYLEYWLVESGANSSGSADAAGISSSEARRAAEGAQMEADAREDQLFGEAGFLLLAVFAGDPEFAVLHVLNKETRKRRVIEARVGESVNGYTIDAIYKLGLEALSPQGDRISRTLFERQQAAPESG